MIRCGFVRGVKVNPYPSGPVLEIRQQVNQCGLSSVAYVRIAHLDVFAYGLLCLPNFCLVIHGLPPFGFSNGGQGLMVDQGFGVTPPEQFCGDLFAGHGDLLCPKSPSRGDWGHGGRGLVDRNAD
jgi:hypothetical protein